MSKKTTRAGWTPERLARFRSTIKRKANAALLENGNGSAARQVPERVALTVDPRRTEPLRFAISRSSKTLHIVIGDKPYPVDFIE